MTTKCKLDFNLFTPTSGKPKEPDSDGFDFNIPKDKLNLKEEVLAKFHEMDPWMKSEFFKEVTTPKIKPQKNKLFELEVDEGEYEYSRRKRNPRLG
jgi:hypothetical protein